MTGPGTAADETFAALLETNARVRGSRPAIREKDYGIWQTWSWAEVREQVRVMAHGFAALGLRRGDKVAIVGDNRPQLYWAMVAAQALGAVPVPVYQDAAAAEMQFVLDHTEARFAVVEDQEQVDKLIEIKPRCPTLETIVYRDSRGLRHYTQSFLHSLASAEAVGREHRKEHPGFYDDEAAKAKGGDAAIMLYTSGTTGQPKGVVLTFDNVIKTARMSVELEGLTEKDETLSYLPMAWVGDNMFSLGQTYVAGFCVNCPESSATVMQDLREIGPTYFFAPPPIFQNILTSVMIRIEDASWIKRRLFRYFLDVARRVGSDILARKPVPFGQRFLYGLGQALVFGPLKNTLGFSRMRLVYTAGEAIGPDIFNFYRSIGVPMKQLYGQTEATVFVTVQPNDQVRLDTVGVACPGVELKLDANGEVLYRSPGVFKEYYRNPAATAETKTSDGWVHTGDAGFLDRDGHLKIVDRAKDVGRLTNGALFAPKYIENKLKFFPFIKEAVIFGADRPFAAAMISIDIVAAGNWAEKRHVAYSSYQELAAKPEVYALIKANIEQVNRDLAADAALAGSQIARFVLLHKELDADDGELTRTRKVRRRFVAERYADIVEAIYSGKDAVHVEAKVSFEDGRTGSLKADLRIADAATVGTEKAGARAGGMSDANPRRIGETVLKVENISLRFGGVRAISDVSFEIRKGEIFSIIGPNGAGKTSMLNVINGFYHPQDGTITWKGTLRKQMRPHEAAATGIARTFQNVALFKGMSTLDNIMTGRLLKQRGNFITDAIYWGPAQREEIRQRAIVERIIDFLEIQAIRKTPVGRLPYGLQKRVELGRALAMEPDLLLLDEPMAGMNVEEKEDMSRFILDVNDEFGTTIALIEHDMGVVMDISDRVVVLDYGRKIADGTPDAVRANPDVIKAYLGVSH